MNRVCQGPHALFAIALAAWLGAAVAGAVSPPVKPASTGIPIHLAARQPQPFADVVLATPELAACFLLSPGWWSTAGQPASLPAEAVLSTALAGQLQGLVDLGALPPAELVIATSANTTLEAVAHGGTALVLMPTAEKTGEVEVARSVAPALLLAAADPASPDPRCGEPLLALGQAIATAGSLTLAALPPELRPVRDWLEPRDAAFALETLAGVALDHDTRWQSRRARLARMGQVGGANPPLAAAAALVVEAFGDPSLARRKPFEMLLAWQKGSGKAFPPLPRTMRSAMGKPLEAGMPKEREKADRDEVRWDALARRLATEPVGLTEVPGAAPLSLRLLAAAQLRARGGSGLCEWLTANPLPSLRTGCRSEGEEGGWVFSRPGNVGFEVVWRSLNADEALLLRWPRWVLFPLVVPSSGDLWFIDEKGVWRLPLDAHAAPQLVSAGSFRYLAASPDGKNVASARWPSGQVVVLRSSGTRELAVNGRGGLAFLDPDVLAASDGTQLSLASAEGEARSGVSPSPCCHSLVLTPGGLTAAATAPCEPGLVRIVLADRSASPLLKLPEGPLGLVALPAGGMVLGTADGLWFWRGEGTPERIGAGLTPGPG
jgi:hypothetical protein